MQRELARTEKARIELAFWDIDSPTTSIVVDCAFVSETDEVAFVGRVIGRGDANRSCAINAAKAIASELLDG